MGAADRGLAGGDTANPGGHVYRKIYPRRCTAVPSTRHSGFVRPFVLVHHRRKRARISLTMDKKGGQKKARKTKEVKRVFRLKATKPASSITGPTPAGAADGGSSTIDTAARQEVRFGFATVLVRHAFVFIRQDQPYNIVKYIAPIAVRDKRPWLIAPTGVTTGSLLQYVCTCNPLV